MQRVTEEDEKEQLTEKKRAMMEEEIVETGSPDGGKNKKKKSKKKKRRRRKKDDDDDDDDSEKETVQESKKKTALNSDLFIIGTYNLIKMLGFGTFGEIHLAYDTSTRTLRAIKFEIASQKNPQLKHEFNILEQLNKTENNSVVPEGIPRVYNFDRIENKCNYMIMDFLGPSLADLFQFRNKQFSLKTVCILAIQMLQRIEYIHEKGFIHRDIKPENFVIGLNEKSNTVHIIDFGLSKRYKDKNTGQHIPYRENRHLVGTARYASLNAHLGVEQSRRDDIESIGYVIAYFILGRLPWQSKQEKGKQPAKIMEKKLITPPEILCKKLPMELSYYFHYCKNLKFEDRPDYSTLKYLFYDLLMQQENVNVHYPEFTFDWYEEEKEEETKKDDDGTPNPLFSGKAATPGAVNKKPMFDLDQNLIINNNNQDNNEATPGYSEENADLINFKDINSNFNQSSQIMLKLSGRNVDQFNLVDLSPGKEKKEDFSFNRNDFLANINVKEEQEMLKLKKANEGSNRDSVQLKNVPPPKKEKEKHNNHHDESWSDHSSGQDTERDATRNDDEDVKKIIKSASDSNKNVDNSDSHYKLLSSSEKSSEDKRKQSNAPAGEEDIILKPKKNSVLGSDIILNIDKSKNK